MLAVMPACFAAQVTLAAPPEKPERPADNLPYDVAQFAYFGERPAWSPDGSRIAFMGKSFGDAFEYDLETQQISLITHYPHTGYLRVQYLPSGDLLLIGSQDFEDFNTTRYNNQELWILEKGSQEPVALGEKISEGVAISRTRNRIAWAITERNYPDRLAQGESLIYVADIANTTGKPAIVNQREVLRAMSPECSLETQDFHNDDTELIYTCYRLHEGLILADVFGVDLETGDITTYRQIEDEYNEVEGIYPDDKYILVESSKDQANAAGSATLDIWRLRLEPNSTDFTRITYFGNNSGHKASNPVVSPDGLMIAFQTGRSEDEPGIGYGLFLLTLED